MDKGWWDAHLNEVQRSFVGQRFSTNNLPERYGSTYLATMEAYGNSGAGCISLALFGDAAQVVMLGFDCMHTGGKAHWHGNHPPGLANVRQIDKWPRLFERLRNDHPQATILNASRTTALDIFPRVTLESVIESLDPHNISQRPAPEQGH